jgi:predicted nucleotidyltransferase
MKLVLKNIREICREFGLSFIVLFGSRASGNKGFKRDYDIAVLPSRPLEEKEELGLICKIARDLQSDDLDLIFLDRSAPLLGYEIAMNGSLIYEKDEGSFNNFRWRALQRWNDV